MRAMIAQDIVPTGDYLKECRTPYEDVANIRPGTKSIVETWLKTYGDARDVILGIEAAGN